MNTKQTPEQAAVEALQRCYDGVCDVGVAYSAKHAVARQSIIKAFQDRESLLDALEGILSHNDQDVDLPSWMLNDARAAIEKAKS